MSLVALDVSHPRDEASPPGIQVVEIPEDGNCVPRAALVAAGRPSSDDEAAAFFAAKLREEVLLRAALLSAPFSLHRSRVNLFTASTPLSVPLEVTAAMREHPERYVAAVASGPPEKMEDGANASGERKYQYHLDRMAKTGEFFEEPEFQVGVTFQSEATGIIPRWRECARKNDLSHSANTSLGTGGCDATTPRC